MTRPEGETCPVCGHAVDQEPPYECPTCGDFIPVINSR